MAKGISDNSVYIAKALKALRAQQGMSQRDLALESKSTVQSISTLERGIGNPVIGNLEKIANTLQTTAPELILLGKSLMIETKMSVRHVIAANIKRVRLGQDISQNHLAKKSDIAPSYISKMEAGKIGFSVDKLEAIAEALGVEEADLVRRVDKFDISNIA
jgi:transcriptional regulator with XRE-family HTH domain